MRKSTRTPSVGRESNFEKAIHRGPEDHAGRSLQRPRRSGDMANRNTENKSRISAKTKNYERTKINELFNWRRLPWTADNRVHHIETLRRHQLVLVVGAFTGAYQHGLRPRGLNFRRPLLFAGVVVTPMNDVALLLTVVVITGAPINGVAVFVIVALMLIAVVTLFDNG